MLPAGDHYYIPRREWAAHIKATHGVDYSPKTFCKAATVGGGPKYVLFGGRAYSTATWLSEWVQGKLSAPRHSTSEAVGPAPSEAA